jgi:hypothetical protein
MGAGVVPLQLAKHIADHRGNAGFTVLTQVSSRCINRLPRGIFDLTAEYCAIAGVVQYLMFSLGSDLHGTSIAPTIACTGLFFALCRRAARL